MYIISKLFTYFILPPGIFIWSLIVSSFLVKKFKLLFFSLGILFYLLSIRPISDSLLKPLENINTTNQKADLVVVLSGDDRRLPYGILLAKQNNTPLLFTGGGIKKPTEADFAKKIINEYEKTFNFKLKTYYEDKALDTVENGKFTLNLIKKDKLSKNIYLVTSAYHMKRSIMIFKHFGFNIIPKPTDFKIKHASYTFYDYLPNMGSLENSYTAIHEYFGILSLLLRGYSLNKSLHF